MVLIFEDAWKRNHLKDILAIPNGAGSKYIQGIHFDSSLKG